jgi:hypothetical protein
MKITVEYLNKIGAFPEIVDWFKLQGETDVFELVRKLIAQDKLVWANWAICKIEDYARIDCFGSRRDELYSFRDVLYSLMIRQMRRGI